MWSVIDAASLFESAMLLAFSMSWYCSIWKMLSTRKACGKSLGVVSLICIGYICGITSKIIIAGGEDTLPPVTALYAWNLLVTSADAALVIYYSKYSSRIEHSRLVTAGENFIGRLSCKAIVRIVTKST
jgi:hypothetical protein